MVGVREGAVLESPSARTARWSAGIVIEKRM